MSLPAGTQLGSYRIEALIGRGGMGEVYRAHDPRLDRPVAIKLLPHSFANDARRLARFEQEARAASNLNHPNIVTVHDVGAADGVHFVVTEFVEGQTLAAQLRSGSRSVGEAVDAAMQVAGALAAAHERGIVHRDIKPENLMLRADGYVKVLDFGLAKLLHESAPVASAAATHGMVETSPGMVVGTAQYMSPEQARGLAVDQRTDLFSLGVVLYEMLTGVPPFSGPTATDTIVSVLHRDPAPVGQHANVPAELERIVHKALQKDRDLRYQTAKDLLADLKQVKQTLSTSSLHRVQSASQVLTRRNFFIAGGGAVAAGAAAAYFLKKPSIPSIAVLPFGNAGQDAGTEYLSDGITEGIINNLAQIPGLRVVSRNTTFRYKGQAHDLSRIRKDLGVGTVLTGRITQRGENVEISTELVDAGTDAQLWGARYNRTTADLQNVQEEVARNVLTALNVRVSADNQQRLSKRSSANAEAHLLYLQGRYHWNRLGLQATRKALSLFEQAVDKDPAYALAWAGIADAYAQLIDWMPDAGEKSRSAARKALQLDESLGEAHVSMGLNHMLYGWDWTNAEKEFQRARALTTSYAVAPQQYGWLLAYTGRIAEAHEQFRRARELDPLSAYIIVDSNIPYYFARDYQNAIKYAINAMELDQDFFLPHLVYGIGLVLTNQTELGIAQIELAYQKERTPWIAANLGWAYARASRRADALQKLTEIDSARQQGYASWAFSSIVHTALGNHNQALSALERAYDQRASWLLFLAMDPMWDPLRSYPTFKALLQRMKLPETPFRA